MFVRDRFYVIADGNDNSITLSEKLFKSICDDGDQEGDVIMSTVGGNYSFMMNPDLDELTRLSKIQYNGKHKTIGFECSAVNNMFHSYGISAEVVVKLSVTKKFTVPGKPYYIIEKPRNTWAVY